MKHDVANNWLSSTPARMLLLLVVAIILSLVVIRSNSRSDVPWCIDSPACTFEEKPVGKATVRQYGYPLTYRQVQSFEPVNNNADSPDYAGYAEVTTETQRMSTTNIVINVVFWFALLKLLADFIPLRKR
jgi:hypothetical protein